MAQINSELLLAWIEDYAKNASEAECELLDVIVSKIEELAGEQPSGGKRKYAYEAFLMFLNTSLSKRYRGDTKSRKQFSARIKEGFTQDDFERAITSLKNNQYHRENNYEYATPEFITRSDKLDKFANGVPYAPAPPHKVAQKTYNPDNKW
jgi:uncharacterized phage protein (TIGR02220 family)